MPLLLDIDAHGRLVPHSDEARRALADRAGPLRAPAVGGRPPRRAAHARHRRRRARARAASLAGDLAALPHRRLHRASCTSRASPACSPSSADGAERSIAFQDGEVRSAAVHRAGRAGRRGGGPARLRDRGAGRARRPPRAARSARRSWTRAASRRTTSGSASTSRSRRCSTRSCSRAPGTFALVDEEPGERVRRAALGEHAVAPHGRHPAHRRAVALQGAHPRAATRSCAAASRARPVTLRPDRERAARARGRAAHRRRDRDRRPPVRVRRDEGPLPPRRGGLRRGGRGARRERRRRRSGSRRSSPG